MCLSRAIYLRHQKLSLFHFHWWSESGSSWWTRLVLAFYFCRILNSLNAAAQQWWGITKCGNFYLMKIMIIPRCRWRRKSRARWEEGGGRRQRGKQIIDFWAIPLILNRARKLLDLWSEVFYLMDDRAPLLTPHHTRPKNSRFINPRTTNWNRMWKVFLWKVFVSTGLSNSAHSIGLGGAIHIDLPLNWIFLSLTHDVAGELPR